MARYYNNKRKPEKEVVMLEYLKDGKKTIECDAIYSKGRVGND